jgi:uncharacterized membrane protein YhaH (DUF805 family)
VFAVIYTYGHLVMAAFSLAMALAFFVAAVRVPAWRRHDAAYSVVFLLTTLGGFVEMTLVLQPSVVWGRLYIGTMALLLYVLTVALHVQHAKNALGPAWQSRHLLGVR